MYISNESAHRAEIENLRGGDGTTVFNLFFGKEDSPLHARLITEIIVAPGCSIGSHTHVHEAEIYYVVSGEGILDDGGNDIIFRKGDCHYCHNGDYHGVRNTSDEPLKLFAIVVTEAEKTE